MTPHSLLPTGFRGILAAWKEANHQLQEPHDLEAFLITFLLFDYLLLLGIMTGGTAANICHNAKG